ncbi:MAG: type II toxin-antitoxin system RelB/DinJ family antitoxin [Oscillospiraceae bacterium]|jgi:DNA-damage-inducible protein J|nr:type II toxin-antitoxin system RelB/DinJ family antitoxin [Oscillospiraceae bacterium]
MAQTTMSIRIDDELKRQFDALCVEFGMNVSTAFTIFAKTVVRQREIPFPISAGEDLFFTHPVNRQRVLDAIADLEAGRGVVHDLVEVDDDD